MAELFKREKFDRVVHLAAQAGVRYSLEAPQAYVDSNITGTLNVLEGCRYNGVQHLVYASTSSVYGANTKMPFSVHQAATHPLSFYAATKRANELMAHNYAHLFRLPVTGLRFFTVYGPWGRPDMALFLFTKNILAGKPIDVFNHGHHRRDFTYVEDIAEGVVRALDRPAQPNPDWNSDEPDPATSNAPYRVYNIGNNAPVELPHYIRRSRQCLGEGDQEPAAAAARRRAGHLRGRLGPGHGRGLQAGDDRGIRDPGVRGLVPGLLQGLSQGFLRRHGTATSSRQTSGPSFLRVPTTWRRQP